MSFPEFEADGVRLINGDCLEVMPTLAAASVDLILTDPPYGVTACKWDTIIPFEPLWSCFKHVLKPKGAVVLTATQPFASMLVMSNREWFKYSLVWDKVRPCGMQTAKFKPMPRHEDVLVFARKSPTYNPIMEPRDKPVKGRIRSLSQSSPLTGARIDSVDRVYTHKYPQSIMRFAKPSNAVHPTQKPVALFEYLIRTYTNEGETVLDATIGSGTTAIASINTGRKCVGIEKDPSIFAGAVGRIEAASLPLLG